jgi:hypothetical protein
MMKVGPRVRSITQPRTKPIPVAMTPAIGAAMNGEMP